MSANFELSFEGNDAEEHFLDFYDAAQALGGFQRSLALTTHFVLHDEIITQAPSLKGARILSAPPEEGSWKATALVISAIGAAALAPRDSTAGHIISSVYDYVVSQTLGFHVDFDEALGVTLERYRAEQNRSAPRESQLDSLIEKCEIPIRDMHRPIAYSGTATSANLTCNVGREEIPVGPRLDLDTWHHISTNKRSSELSVFSGWTSSYNINTFKGRAFLPDFGRPVPFTLAESARDAKTVALLTTSLDENAKSRMRNDVRLGDEGRRHFQAYVNTSANGRLKSIFVTAVTIRHPYEL